MLKYLLFIIFLFSINLYSNSNNFLDEDILFEYNYDYIFYGYNTFEKRGVIHSADIFSIISLNNDKFNSNIPYDGKKIVITKSKKIFYIFSKNITNKKIIKTKILDYDPFFLTGNDDNKSKHEFLLRLNLHLGLDLREKLEYSEIEYISFTLEDKEFEKIQKEVKLLNEEIEKYLRDSTVTNKYIKPTYTIGLGYITQLNIDTKKYLYVNSDNEINYENFDFYEKIDEIEKILLKYKEDEILKQQL